MRARAAWPLAGALLLPSWHAGAAPGEPEPSFSAQIPDEEPVPPPPPRPKVKRGGKKRGPKGKTAPPPEDLSLEQQDQMDEQQRRMQEQMQRYRSMQEDAQQRYRQAKDGEAQQYRQYQQKMKEYRQMQEEADQYQQLGGAGEGQYGEPSEDGPGPAAPPEMAPPAPPEGHTGEMTLKDARLNLATVVETHVFKHGPDGFLLLRDKKGKAWKLRLESVHDDTVRQLGRDLFVACASMRETAGRQLPLDVDFTVDFSGSRWKVKEITIHAVNGKPRFMYKGRRRVPPRAKGAAGKAEGAGEQDDEPAAGE